MEIKIVKEKIQEIQKKWNEFIIENGGSFLQSFEWGSFQESLSKKVWKIQISNKEDVFLEALIIKEKLPLNQSFLYIPFGPVFKKEIEKDGKEKILSFFLEKIKELLQKEGAIFLHIEPANYLPNHFGLVFSVKRIQPEKTLILEIDKPEEEIFQSFHPKLRYNIRLAEKKGVKVFVAKNNEKEKIDLFYSLLKETAKRKKIKIYPKEYYQKMLALGEGDLECKLVLAEFEKKIISGSILLIFGKRATYLHGGLDYRYRNLMSPHLLQWKQILLAKSKGCNEYDFWGIDEKKWPGVTRFKKSFGGKEVVYPQSVDLIFRPIKYFVYKYFRKIIKRK